MSPVQPNHGVLLVTPDSMHLGPWMHNSRVDDHNIHILPNLLKRKISVHSIIVFKNTKKITQNQKLKPS